MFSCVCGQAYGRCAMQMVSRGRALDEACGFQPQLYEGVSYRSPLGAFEPIRVRGRVVSCERQVNRVLRSLPVAPRTGA